MVIYCVSVISVLLVRSNIPGAAGTTGGVALPGSAGCRSACTDQSSSSGVEIMQSIKYKPQHKNQTDAVLLCEDTHALNPVCGSGPPATSSKQSILHFERLSAGGVEPVIGNPPESTI